VDLVNDCTAAALGHTFGRQEPGTFLIYSMGFQGFECGLVRFARQQFRELAHDGAAEPAGRDVDQRLMVAVITELKKMGIDVPVRVWTGQHWFELRALVSGLKERLSSEEEAVLEIPSFLTNADPIRFSCTRQILEETIAPAVDETLKIVERTLEEAGLRTRDVEQVLLVGGSTRLSIVQKRLEAMFSSRLVQVREDLLARGAAIQASRLGEQAPATESLTRLETVTRVEPARPDLEATFAYAQQLIEQGQIEMARTFLEEIRARTSELLSHLPAN
jgi:molecular chaperone DnaK (HSP70)